jgi:hypothetical protein
MSYYAAPVGPASPVPSYQASSQSGGTSPHTNSVRSIPSVSTNPYSPTWSPSSPINPFFYADSSAHSSPSANICSLNRNVALSFDNEDVDCNNLLAHDKGVTTFKSQKHVEREYGSNMRALELLEATAGADVRNVNRPTRDEVSEGIRVFKSYKQAIQERSANSKALMLLQETAGYDVKCTAVPVDIEASNVVLSCGARPEDTLTTCPDSGIIHLEEVTARDNDNYSGGEYYRVSMLSRSLMTARQEAEESHLLRKKMVAMYKLKKAAEREIEATSMRKVHVTDGEKQEHQLEPNGESCAGSGRSGIPENLYLSNVGNSIRPMPRDETENIRAYKSKVQSARERGANTKALMLLQETAGYDVKCTAVLVDKLECTVESLSEHVDEGAMRKSSIRSTVQESDAALQRKIDGEVDDESAAELISNDSPILTPRQEAEESKLIRKKLIAMYKLKKATEKELKLHEQKTEREDMAESTRKIQRNTGEDLDSTETIAAMKCSVDIERENFAKKKALQLLNDRPGCLA